MTFDDWAEEVECISYRRHGQVLPCSWLDDDATTAWAEGQFPGEYVDLLELRHHVQRKPTFYSKKL
jgi:hypothetical protein